MKLRLRAKADGTFAWSWGGWLDGLREVQIWVGGYSTAAAALAAAQLSASRQGTAMYDTIEAPTGEGAAPDPEAFGLMPRWLKALPAYRDSVRYRK